MMPIHGPHYTMREYACPECPRRQWAEVRPECPDDGVLMEPQEAGQLEREPGRATKPSAGPPQTAPPDRSRVLTTSKHDRSPLARIALAAGGIATLFAAAAGLYAVDTLIGGLRGLAAGVILACALTAVCGLVSRVATPRHQVITRPGPVRLPEPAEELPEPTRTAA